MDSVSLLDRPASSALSNARAAETRSPAIARIECLRAPDAPRLDAMARAIEMDALQPVAAGGWPWAPGILAHLADAGEAHVVSCAGRPAGIFMMQEARMRWGLPWPLLKSSETHLSFDGTPLLDRKLGVAALEALIGSVHPATPILFRMVPGSGPFAEALAQACETTGAHLAITQSYERAAHRCAGSFADWFDAAFPRKRRKEFRRLKSRLGESGNLVVRPFAPGDDIEEWTDAFLALESAGWKGRRGTAVAQSDSLATVVRQSLRQLAAERRLAFWRFDLDGRPIALLFATISSRTAWLGKIAFDESFARFSPGVLLVLEATEDLMRRGEIDIVDSSALPDHPMINHIWRDRLAFADVLVGPPGMPKPVFQALTKFEKARIHGRARCKAAWHSIKRRQKA